MKLVKALSRHEFAHDFNVATAKQRAGRWLFEVYPHPAMVRLFGLAKIIRYKKGSVAEKAARSRDSSPPFRKIGRRVDGIGDDADT